MILEAFFSTVASNVFTEIFKRAMGKKGLNEHEIERIVEDVLRRYQLAGQAPVIRNEIFMILGDSGVLGSSGQLLLPSSREIPALPERLTASWWDMRVYQIVSVLSEKVLSVLDWKTDDGAPIIQWDYLDGANQQWRFIPVGDHGELFKIHSQNSAKVLDVQERRTDNGTPIIQWHYHGGANQHWRLSPIGSTGEVFKITSEFSKKVLDVSDEHTENGATIIQWDYHAGTNQQWRLVPVK